MKSLFSILIFSTLLIGAVSAQGRKSQFNVDNTALAIEGYDPVAYFTSSKAIKGKKEITMSYEGITYRFSSAQNRDLFKTSPNKYVPQYGGWCAYAMGDNGEKVSVDPETFKVLNGKLYLFYNSFLNNTLKTWNKDEVGLKTKADKNWSKFN